MGPSRPNPLGGWGLRAISWSFVVDDALHRLLLSSRPHLANPSAYVIVFMEGSTKERL